MLGCLGFAVVYFACAWLLAQITGWDNWAYGPLLAIFWAAIAALGWWADRRPSRRG